MLGSQDVQLIYCLTKLSPLPPQALVLTAHFLTQNHN